nr:hypothetical protein [Burkholderia glumae]
MIVPVLAPPACCTTPIVPVDRPVWSALTFELVDARPLVSVLTDWPVLVLRLAIADVFVVNPVDSVLMLVCVEVESAPIALVFALMSCFAALS